jgi:hypothetical protein
LNIRQAASGEDGTLANKLQQQFRQRKELSYTQKEAREIQERNSADDNAAFARLAERIIQQQDAAVSSPAVIRASLPEQPRVLTFRRAVAIDPWADLHLEIKAKQARAASAPIRIILLGAILTILVIVYWAGRRLRVASPTMAAQTI